MHWDTGCGGARAVTPVPRLETIPKMQAEMGAPEGKAISVDPEMDRGDGHPRRGGTAMTGSLSWRKPSAVDTGHTKETACPRVLGGAGEGLAGGRI